MVYFGREILLSVILGSKIFVSTECAGVLVAIGDVFSLSDPSGCTDAAISFANSAAGASMNVGVSCGSALQIGGNIT